MLNFVLLSSAAPAKGTVNDNSSQTTPDKINSNEHKQFTEVNKLQLQILSQLGSKAFSSTSRFQRHHSDSVGQRLMLMETHLESWWMKQYTVCIPSCILQHTAYILKRVNSWKRRGRMNSAPEKNEHLYKYRLVQQTLHSEHNFWKC